jgi:hypothetical protein
MGQLGNHYKNRAYITFNIVVKDFCWVSTLSTTQEISYITTNVFVAAELYIENWFDSISSGIDPSTNEHPDYEN